MKKTIKWLTLAAASAITCTAFVACVPSDLDGAKTKLEEKEYEVVVTEKDDMGILAPNGVVGMLYAERETTVTVAKVDGTGTEEKTTIDTLEAWLFENKDAAKSYYEEYVAYMSSKGEDVVVLVEQKGKWVYTGTEDAMKDFD